VPEAADSAQPGTTAQVSCEPIARTGREEGGRERGGEREEGLDGLPPGTTRGAARRSGAMSLLASRCRGRPNFALL